MTRWLLALVAALLLAPTARAVDEADLLPIDEAFALTAKAGDDGAVVFHWRIADGYYLYRHRMGAEASDGAYVASGPLQLPDGIAYTDEFFGDVQTYRGDVTGTLPGAPAAGARSASFRVKYQGCADVGICYPPHTREITVALPARPAGLDLGAPSGAADPLAAALGGQAITDPAIAAGGLPLPEAQAFRFDAIAEAPDRLLLRFEPAPGYYLYRDRTTIMLEAPGLSAGAPQWPPSQPHQDEHFGDVQVYFDPVEVPLPLRRATDQAVTATLRVSFQGCQDNGICYPPMTREVVLPVPAGPVAAAVAPDSPPTGDAGTEPPAPDRAGAETPSAARAGGPSLWLALLLALGGGVILNLMPCVLPVLSLKALSLAQGGGDHRKARAHALWYTAGVLLSFAAVGAAALALRQAGLALGRGFQLQQPGVIAALALVMVAIGLSLSGVVNFGASLAGTGQSLAQKSGPAGDFFTGVLAVVVASPCTAPLMSGALAFAFVAPTSMAMTVFLALGLGLALPFLAIGFMPALARRLPRPGAWMETFKQLLAFPMYLTAVWLLWVLGKQGGIDALAYALAGIVVLALALWRWEKARWNGGAVARALALALLLLAIWPLWRIPQLAAPAAATEASDGAVAYSAQTLDRLRAEGRTVFVNMTADWCVTCKANEKRVLDTDAFRQTLAAHEAVYMKGDWTRVDPAITAFLEAHGAVGVPLYVVLRPGRDNAVLPTVLTQDAVDAALAAP